MLVTVRYFASLRETLGAQESVEVGEGCTVSRLRQMLVERSAAHARVLAAERAVRCAVDQLMAEDSTVLASGVEVAFFPPVTGG
jgi:molybdopterin synthase sulfur carrier subunit